MRLAFVNPDLLDQSVDEALMPDALERFWHDRASPLAKSLYARIGITERVPFVLDQYSNPPQIHPQSSSVLRKMTEQMPGRTTMRTYGQHVLRFVAKLAEDGGDLATVDPGYFSQYRLAAWRAQRLRESPWILFPGTPRLPR